MKIMKLAALMVALLGLVLVPPSVSGQSRTTPEKRARELTVLAGRGGQLGVRVTDAESGGVRIEEVDPDGVAEKAGLKRGDIIVEFDGERIRSSRQFARLVQETAPGRSVKATITRDGQKRDVQVTLTEDRTGRNALIIDGKRLPDGDLFFEKFGDLGKFRDLAPFNYKFDFDFPGLNSGARLGITVTELTTQLAGHFGVKDGVLVSSVNDGSAASRAGIKAGDVITSVNGRSIASSEDLIRSIRDTDNEEISIGIVRDRKEMTMKAKIEPRRPARNARPV